MQLFKLKNKKYTLFLILIYLISFLNPIYAQNKTKNSNKDLENKKKKINEEIKEINLLLNETKGHKKSSIGELIKINIKLKKRQELITTINFQISELDLKVMSNEQESKRLANNLIQLKKDYARMLIFAQLNQDAYSSLMFIFSSSNFNQAYFRLKYIQQYSEFRKKQALEIISTKKNISIKLNELKDAHLQQKDLLNNEVNEKQNLSVEKSQQELILAGLQKKEKNLKIELQKKKIAEAQLQLSIKKLIELEVRKKAEKLKEIKNLAEKKKNEDNFKSNQGNASTKITTKEVKKSSEVVIEKKVDLYTPELSKESEALSANFSNNKGKLPWPVTKGIICETYGEHEHPAIKGFMMFNYGLNICVTKGTQARSIFEGEVTSIAVSPTGGKLVIIRHGEYLSVYCNLDQILVKTGQKISVKQELGVILYNEEEGKASMNIQIWKGQKTIDPSGWLFNAL